MHRRRATSIVLCLCFSFVRTLSPSLSLSPFACLLNFWRNFNSSPYNSHRHSRTRGFGKFCDMRPPVKSKSQKNHLYPCWILDSLLKMKQTKDASVHRESHFPRIEPSLWWERRRERRRRGGGKYPNPKVGYFNLGFCMVWRLKHFRDPVSFPWKRHQC